ncbi:type II secretion system protein [Lactobacillus sp. Sy-1]|uniref:type II secretion system protein n=1 Tax=Lactobacillus sp. Sy-1 TaxID=2109645 RepID=UPI001C583042|nr:type II secretion system protein [Lactobacillus sp. Sy-1]MBW1605765.1 hypothetical protein [Lactobacillus sp. Sy-1]
MPKSRSAFTVLESLIVLVIAGLVLAMGVFAVRSYNVGRVQERYFWQSFQKHWQFSERFAVENNSEVTVTFFTRSVQFIYHDHDYQAAQINYPKGLLAVQNKSTVRIRKAGHVSPKTVYFKSDNYQKTIKQTFQLGWGVYRIKYEE